MKKKLLSLLAVVASIGVASAAEVVFDFTNTEQLKGWGIEAPASGSVKVADGTAMVAGEVTFTSVEGSNRIFNSTAAAAPGLEFRGYKNGVLALSANEGSVVKKVVFKGAILQNSYSFNCGTFTLGEKVNGFYSATWVGDDEKVIMSLGGNISITSMTVTYGAPSKCRYPSIEPNSATFYEGFNTPGLVEISLPEGAQGKIMYKTSEDESFKDYTAPVEISKSTTVTAKTVLDGEESIEVSADFVVQATTPVASVAEFLNAQKDSYVRFTIPLTVVFHQNDAYGQNIFVTDGKDFAVIKNKTDLTFSNGDKLPANITGKVSVGEDSFYERVLVSIEESVKTPGQGHLLMPETLTVSQLKTGGKAAYNYHYVLIKNVSVSTGNYAWDAVFSDGTGSVDAYDAFSEFETPFAGTYNVAGIVNDESGVLKVYPIVFTPGSVSIVTLDFSKPQTFGVEEPASGKYTALAEGQVIESNGVKFTNIKNAKTTTRFFNSTSAATPGIELRAYKGAKFKITAPEGKAFKSIVMKGTILNNGKDVSAGFFSCGKSKIDNYFAAEWEGDDNEITIEATDGNFFIQSMNIFYDTPAPVRYPKFTPGESTFYEGVNTPAIIKLSCETPDVVLYYQINDQEEFTEYTSEGIKVETSCSITAKAVKGDDESVEVTANYEVVTPAIANSVAEFVALKDGDVVKFNVPLTVTYQQNDAYGKYTFVTDGTRSLTIKGDLGKTYQNGDQFPVGVAGFRETGDYTFMNVLIPVVESLGETTTAEAAPLELTIKEVLEDNTLDCHYVILKEVNFAEAGTAYNYNVTDNTSASIVAYDQFSAVSSVISPCNLTAIACNTLSGMQLYPVKLENASGVDDVEQVSDDWVKGEAGAVSIFVNDASKVVVYSANGQVAANLEVAAGHTSVALAPGFYIVKVGNKVTKVTVK